MMSYDLAIYINASALFKLSANITTYRNHAQIH